MNSSNRTPKLTKRRFLKGGALAFLGSFVLVPKIAWAKHYLDVDEAQKLIWGEMQFTPSAIELTKEQMKSIKKASKVRVRNAKVNAFRSEQGDWFILDQVLGKHEFIDIAVGLDAQGQVKGIEILTYRESYGYEIMNPKWRAQFDGRGSSELLKLDKQIKNISGATLSCRHITDGINRLTHTWAQVLRNS